MNLMKNLFLGSTTALVVVSGARAADLPLKAKAVEYVKVCSLYGAGFYYIPGTETCIKLGGYMRADLGVNTNAIFMGNTSNQAGAQNRHSNAFTWRARADLTFDTRTATDYGVVRSYFDGGFTWTSGGYAGLRVGGTAYDGNPTGGISGGQLNVFFAFIQFAGFTMGKAVSQFTAPWGNYPGNIYDGLVGGGGAFTGVNQFTYTAEFGDGISGSIGVQDPSAYYQAGIHNLGVGSPGTIISPPFLGIVFFGSPLFGYGLSANAGTTFPDIVGQLRVDQAWGLFQASAAAHHNNPAYYGGDETTGGPRNKWGWAGQLALTIRNIPTGPGDVINVSAVYTNGATRYNIQDMAAQAGGSTIYSGFGVGSVGFGFAPDSVYAPNGDLELVTTWGMRGAYVHNWNQYWSSSIFGAYASVRYTGGAKAYMCGVSIPGALGGGLSTCNPDYNIGQVGANIRWTPVKNLTFTTEAAYSMLDQKFAGVAAVPPNWAVSKPGGNYAVKDQEVWTVMFRAQRAW
ncbi:putative porin [Nitrobacter winogradskyi Nb-255]|uniref:Porin n=1 Tax=Nitrobacter winogradskyi (strain ATCC 25391 / DSM 10237 / CIP 104748 / NCIMB 11846 / Nb-255) TaxID=323098 RepID=Q3SUW1_NITWN|nr:porin [Nitrobacter winogradskyi]ABA03930.1 putative porin [Nitrobacter winogradskyi Nb-255]